MSNPAITKAAVSRRNARIDDANSNFELAGLRRREIDQATARAHRAALNTIHIIDAVRDAEMRRRPMASRLEDLRSPQVPAILPDAPVVHTVAAHQSLTARLVAMTLGGLMLFMAGVATGRML